MIQDNPYRVGDEDFPPRRKERVCDMLDDCRSIESLGEHLEAERAKPVAPDLWAALRLVSKTSRAMQ